jgi:hypothetical protein
LSPPTPENPSLKLGNFPFPGTCIFNRATGLPCPGCGLTRSIVSAVHGDMKTSFKYHRMGILVLSYISLQLVFSIGLLAIPNFKKKLNRFEKLLNKGIIFVFIILFLSWILSFFIESWAAIPYFAIFR